MLASNCTNHPDRAAIGVCVLCRKPICIECSTPMAGIHRCADCLAGLERDTSSQPRAASAAHPLVWAMILLGLVLPSLGWASVAAVFG
ncbi:MAG: hypothetical protein ACOCVR_01210 [Myxococcota bacterium]